MVTNPARKSMSSGSDPSPDLDVDLLDEEWFRMKTQRELLYTGTMAARGQHLELSRRSCSVLDVTLYWRRRTGEVSLALHDAGTGYSFELEVDPADALDAFEPSYSYASTLPIAAKCC